jgi:hypothetical protein
MNRSHLLAGGAARSAAVAGVAAVAALLVAGCGPSSSSASGGSNGSTGSGSSSSSGQSSSSGKSSSSGGSSAITTAAYFPVGAGYTWVYKESGFGGKGTSTQKVLSIKPSAAGQVATMSDTLTYPIKKTFKESLIFRPDGSIEVPLTQFGATVKLESGSIVWPSTAQLASGQPYHNTIVMKIDEAGHDETLKMPLTVRGEGTSSVTVPAGTYQAALINETMDTSFDGYKISMAVRTWVANGVGPVKSEVLSDMLGGSSNAPISTEELMSFTKG